MHVLICPRCYDRILQTGWFINSINLFLMVLEAGSTRPRCQQTQRLMRTLFHSVIVSLSSRGRMGKIVLWGPFCKGTNLIYEGSTFKT